MHCVEYAIASYHMQLSGVISELITTSICHVGYLISQYACFVLLPAIALSCSLNAHIDSPSNIAMLTLQEGPQLHGSRLVASP